MFNEMCVGMDANFTTWGSCFVAGIGMGSEIIFMIIIFAILGFILYKFNVPTEATLVLGVGMVFAMVTGFGGQNQEIMTAILALTMLGFATLIVLAVLKFAKK